MRVLVTGGAGYIGSTLVPRLLAGGHEVTVADRLSVGDGRSLLQSWSEPGFTFVQGDLRQVDVRSKALQDVDAIVHLAAIVGDPAGKRDPEETREVNVDATLALEAEATAAGVQRFVFASTCSNYGRMSDSETAVTEDAPLQPLSLYAETKVEVEKHLLGGGSGGDMSRTCLRFATAFGVSPRMRFDLTVNQFPAELLANGSLKVFGEQFWRPYCHIVDLCRAVEITLAAPVKTVDGAVFNVGSDDQNHRKSDIVDMSLTHVPDAVVERVPLPDDPRDYRVAFSRINDTLGFETTKNVASGIDEVVRLVRSGIVSPDSDVFRN